jgi:hypothetical protein
MLPLQLLRKWLREADEEPVAAAAVAAARLASRGVRG